MNEPQVDKIYNKAIKIASVHMNYKPGPIMEEKLIKMIRRKKFTSIMYKVGFFTVIVLTVFLIGSEKLGIINLNSTFSTNENIDSTSQIVLNDTETSKTSDETTLSNSTNGEDPMFKMMKYVSIASDGNWLTDW